jgi:hypothetical protein
MRVIQDFYARGAMLQKVVWYIQLHFIATFRQKYLEFVIKCRIFAFVNTSKGTPSPGKT